MQFLELFINIIPRLVCSFIYILEDLDYKSFNTLAFTTKKLHS